MRRQEANMREVFLSYRYDDENRRLAQEVEQLLESHNLRAVTGDVLGGEAITPEIKEQIEQADALVALLTRRDQKAEGGWTTHQFCIDELNIARAKHKPAIALIADGVQVGGMFQEHEHIKYDADKPLPAFLKLSSTLWRWKRRAGRLLRVQILPPQVVQELYARGGECTWEYRVSNGHRDSDWQSVEPRKEGQGVFLLVRVQEDTTFIDIRVRHSNSARLSGFVPLHVPVSLES
jgi:hypothetical protein